jgi:hypothetical protein
VKRIIILGGGIAGLLAAYAFRRFKPTLIEGSAKLGGAYTSGGLKYIHDTPEIRQLLDELQLPYAPYRPQGRLWLDGTMYPHPETLALLSEELRHEIQFKHWTKTRGTEQGFRPDCMNDPLGSHSALRCDHDELLRRLEQAVRGAGCEVRLGNHVTGIEEIDLKGAVHLKAGQSICSMNFDALVPTLPLGMLSKLAPWAGLPPADATRLAIFKLEINSTRNRGQHAWEYAYTPRVKWVSRLVHPEPHRIIAEAPLFLLQSEVHGFTTPETFGQTIANIVRDEVNIDASFVSANLIQGHLRPLDKELNWPDGWHPLGRFAQWDSRATADKVYARALTLAANT